ncbi:hypothetical protein OZ410_07580 [Robiginitalea sp. M366]|nr:hypothetical protein [Robiginitalea aestuariiviva]MDG1572173.1 hypothetical protein [Robiginitalea aestuariiviva]
MNAILILVVLSVIVVAEVRYLQGNTLEAIFIGLWAPTIMGFLNYFKIQR